MLESQPNPVLKKSTYFVSSNNCKKLYLVSLMQKCYLEWVYFWGKTTVERAFFHVLEFFICADPDPDPSLLPTTNRSISASNNKQILVSFQKQRYPCLFPTTNRSTTNRSMSASNNKHIHIYFQQQTDPCMFPTTKRSMSASNNKEIHICFQQQRDPGLLPTTKRSMSASNNKHIHICFQQQTDPCLLPTTKRSMFTSNSKEIHVCLQQSKRFISTSNNKQINVSLCFCLKQQLNPFMIKHFLNQETFLAIFRWLVPLILPGELF